VEILQHVRDLVAASSSIDQETLEPQIKAMAESQGVKLGVCINALRVALTGKATGLGIFDTFSILGRERALVRIDRCLAQARAF
jgi:glutamyl-tRNA synthetase